MTFWTMFYDWHVRTDHEWDTRLHLEAMGGFVSSVQNEIGEALLPAVRRLALRLASVLDSSEKP